MAATTTDVVYSHTVKSFIDHVLIQRAVLTPVLRGQLAALG